MFCLQARPISVTIPFCLMLVMFAKTGQGEDAWNEGFEDPHVSWTLGGSTGRFQVDFHGRIRDEARPGDGCERIRLLCPPGEHTFSLELSDRAGNTVSTEASFIVSGDDVVPNPSEVAPMSLTQVSFGADAEKSRSRRLGATGWECRESVVVRKRRFRWPSMPSSCIRRATRLRPTCRSLALRSSRIRGLP